MINILKGLLILVIYFSATILVISMFMMFYAAIFQDWQIFERVFTYQHGLFAIISSVLAGAIAVYMLIVYVQYLKFHKNN